MKLATIDYETFYSKECSVTTLGSANYVAQSDAYIVSVVVDGEGHCGTIKEMSPMMEQLVADPTVQPMAANSEFDRRWTEKYWGPMKNSWKCCLDVGAFNQFPRNLAQLAGTVLGTKVDKTKRDEMLGVRYEDLSETEQTEIQQYCLNDSIVETEVYKKMPAISAFEDKVAEHTRRMNARGVCINTELVEEDKTRLEKMRFDAMRAIPWSRDEKPLSYPALVKYCNFKGLPVPKSVAKTSEECTEFMDICPELSEVVGNMRRLRRSNTMLKKAETLLRRVTPEGVLPLDLLYCGAPHTRRWSSKGFNVQNLDKEPMKTGVGEESVWTRNWLIPRPGCIFGIYDFAQIEPRCLNWLAGNDDMMAALRNGFSYYEAYVIAAKQAARVGWSGNAGTLKKEIGIAKYTKIKNECLGCGYGMGPNKYMTYANVELAEAKQVVGGFRLNNPKITGLWRQLDKVIAQASSGDRHLSLTMPTGEVLQYFGIQSKSGGYEGFVTKGDFGALSKQPRLWGGLLTENITQRMARDVMANAIINLEAAGIPIVFTCHDEVIVEVPIASQKEAAVETQRIMCTPPEWAPDLPLGVEGDFVMAYTK